MTKTNNTLQYFTITEAETIDSLKKQYKKLAFTWHPDITKTDTTAQMQAVNNEYEAALKILSTQTGKNYSLDAEFITIIDALIKLKMQDVIIEICGYFIYISGNTKPYKVELKTLKLWWNNQKGAWYYKPNWWSKTGGNKWDMAKIRSVYGSEVVTDADKQKSNNTSGYIPAME